MPSRCAALYEPNTSVDVNAPPLYGATIGPTKAIASQNTTMKEANQPKHRKAADEAGERAAFDGDGRLLFRRLDGGLSCCSPGAYITVVA